MLLAEHHRIMIHLAILESPQEARVALGYASSKSYTSFLLSKLLVHIIIRWCTLKHESIIIAANKTVALRWQRFKCLLRNAVSRDFNYLSEVSLEKLSPRNGHKWNLGCSVIVKIIISYCVSQSLVAKY